MIRSNLALSHTNRLLFGVFVHLFGISKIRLFLPGLLLFYSESCQFSSKHQGITDLSEGVYDNKRELGDCGLDLYRNAEWLLRKLYWLLTLLLTCLLSTQKRRRISHIHFCYIWNYDNKKIETFAKIILPHQWRPDPTTKQIPKKSMVISFLLFIKFV